jgi:hypothetical protein
MTCNRKYLSAIIAVCLVSGSFASCQKNALVGAYAKTSVSAPEAKAAAEFAVAAQTAAQKTAIDLIAITAAETQVVAGTNYKLTLEVLIDGKKQSVEAIVWWQAWRQPDPYQLSSWTVK